MPENNNKQGPGGGKQPPQREGEQASTPREDKPVNQGEGDRLSARRYNEHLKEFMAAGRVEPAAREAARSVSGPEADSLRAAENAGKAPSRLGLADRVRGRVNQVIGSIRRWQKHRHERSHR